MLTTHTAPTDQPLRGRERELARVHDVLEHGRRGGSALLLIEGQPGCGKTRLMRECMTLADRLGYVTAHTGSTQRAARPARSAWQRHHLQAPGHREAAVRHHAPVRPVLVPIDEFQGTGTWPETAGVLRKAAHHDRVVWVVARRTGMGPDPSCLLLSDPTSRFERLVLEALPRAAALELAADLLGAALSPLLARLVEQFDGHPRLITELLTGLREEQSIQVVDGRATLLTSRLPDRLRARVRTTLAQYSPECRQLLCVAAVMGEEVEYEELAALLHSSPSALLPVVEEACSTGIVRHDGASTVFHNDLVRQIIDDQVPAALKRALYREAAVLRTARRGAEGEPLGRAGTRGAGRDVSGAVPASAADSAAVSAGDVSAAHADGDDRPCLSDQQCELIRLVGEGLTNQQMARRLGLSPHTVNYHLRKLFKSFGVNSRIDLLRAVERVGAVRAVRAVPSLAAGSQEP
ncbi:LuxR family transcriptional regulator [Streptomyces sp. UNOC14_S4]|uniref:helix-turn-helix transcriptional regulator n=1 Tax=Streptomyces sp. UNOC14_S4 TaxID=2872340 RepID=UPI001E37AA6B|nr:LuxR family transcriptional regulator [Streptomyces sp. UNOC14_S4]MCC3771273.1 LuxR C-terminal-related transcriptional regulator [Streptomyces sp. UNOC14_S4]